MKAGEQDDLLSKLANKAKRKLNKQNDEQMLGKGGLKAKYEFVEGSRKEEQKKLEKKIVQLIKNNPDCVDPIGKLIDHAVYDKLSDEKKQTYILKLSQSYRSICERNMV